MKQEKGLSLLEVVCSVVIIGIILISFSKLIINSNKVAAYNNEKLVTINLADAALAKVQGIKFTKNPAISNINDYFVVSNGVQQTIDLNGKTYNVTYDVNQSNSGYAGGGSEKELNLVKVVVTVEGPNGTKKSSSEGYVKIE